MFSLNNLCVNTDATISCMQLCIQKERLPKQCFHCRVPGGVSKGPRGLTQGPSGSASALKCCKTHTIVAPTPKKLTRNCTFFFFAVKHNEFGAFSVQDALEARMAAPAPRELPREFPESLRKPSRCLREQNNTVWVLALGL